MSAPNGRSRPDKRELRARLLTARRARGAPERERAGSAVRETLLELPWLAQGATVACYYSVGGEPDTRALVHALWKRGTHVILPVFLPDGSLDWAVFDGPDSLAPAGRGLVEPVGHRHGPRALEHADAVVCPALAVDRQGNRMGRGAGCYDRALAHKGPRTPAIAVVHDEEFVGELPTEPHDRPVDAVVTPSGGLHVFGPGAAVWSGG
ncbi:5-formyltetrahydrofolate cyclo-ligase [Nocardiopsis terrae]|uniref:5-formyltetrahydrofolate cyclo-ligase n=1 Tax=Nocardiopsis terrae TaxID=372655 RepID=A0ABR9HBA0_9ACTN|nr:5-formyltetrahydrofolate cyclo-ligase [Nocardiopsis terrae]MBE1456302.1 5-formyltetrahydrofolate cyclo-ligase [Nocardiopsis terrae]GHC77617.1 5-formyltetrahydrofolate cyclo-ligase [Nocardiopsis terrae]